MCSMSEYRTINRLLCLLLITSIGFFIGSPSFGDDSDREKNRIKPYDENKRYWQYEGEPVFLLGGNKIANPFQKMEENELISYLDELQSAGGNYFRNIMSDREPGNIRAFQRTDTGQYDLTEWNESYWEGLRTMLKKASERNIIVNITFWDRFDHYDQTHHRIESRHDLWERSPWNPVNNVNYTIEESGLDSTYDAHPISGENPFHQTPPIMQDLPVVLQFQERFIEKILDVSLEYDNVIYNMGNEHQLQLKDWDRYWGEFVRNYAAEKGRGIETTAMFDHVIERDGEWQEVQGFPPVIHGNDIYTFIEGSKLGSQWTDPGEVQYNDAIRLIEETSEVESRPVNAVKVRTQNIVHNPQARLWRLLFGGFAALSHHRDYVEGLTSDGWPIGGLALTEMAKTNIQAMRTFTDLINPWESAPRQDLLSDRDEDEAYLLADVGSIYGLYFPKGSGSVGLDLQQFEESFGIHWIDIGQGEVVVESEIDGGDVVTIDTPYDVEYGWACVIRRVND